MLETCTIFLRLLLKLEVVRNCNKKWCCCLSI